MKWIFFTIVLVAAQTAAGALLPRTGSNCPGSPQTLYKFLVESDNTDLDGRYLSTGSGEDSIGLYSSANKDPDYIAYSVASPLATATDDLIELHAWPATPDDHVFCVQRVSGSALWFIMDELSSFSNRRIESIYKHWEIKNGYLTYQFPYSFSNPDETVWYLYQYAPDPTTYTIRWRTDDTYDSDYYPIRIKVEEYCESE